MNTMVHLTKEPQEKLRVLHMIASYTGPEECSWSATEAVIHLKAKNISPSELIDAAIKRMKQVEPSVNAVVTICEERALKAAQLRESERQQDDLLSGLPVGIKDLTPVEGVRTTFGNVGYADFVPQTSDALVSLIERNGGIILGKTNTPEFGAGANTFNDVFGYTRNPYDTRMNAGGSSGGAAVSLATGELWLSHGTDLAGSLRTPASFNNVVGLRPTPGRCASTSPAAFMIEATAGPMARNVCDLALFLDAMAGVSNVNPLSIEAPQQSFCSMVDTPIDTIKISFSVDQNGFAPVTPEMQSILSGAMLKVQKAGHVVEHDCPDLPNLYETYVIARGLHYATMPAQQPMDIRRHYKRTLAENVASGLKLTLEDFVWAHRQRTIIIHKMAEFFQKYDVLALPVTGIAPGPVEIEYPLEINGCAQKDYVDWLRFSFLATTCGLPALVIPAGFTQNCLPVGIQLIGKPRGEGHLLQIGRALELIFDINTHPIDPNIQHQ